MAFIHLTVSASHITILLPLHLLQKKEEEKEKKIRSQIKRRKTEKRKKEKRRRKQGGGREKKKKRTACSVEGSKGWECRHRNSTSLLMENGELNVNWWPVFEKVRQ